MIIEDIAAPYIAGAVLIVVGVTAGALLWQRHTIKELRATVALREAALQGYAGAQRTNLATIDALQRSLQDIVNASRLELAAMRREAADSVAESALLHAQNATLKNELEAVYAKSPSARAWGDVGVDRDVADRLPGGAHHPDAHH